MITTVHFHDVLNQHIAMKKRLKWPSASRVRGSCDRDVISYREVVFKGSFAYLICCNALWRIWDVAYLGFCGYSLAMCRLIN